MKSESDRKKICAVRGPVHVGPNYIVLGLDVVYTQVCEAAKSFAHTNRDDFIRAKGVILLAGFMGQPSGLFAIQSVQVLCQVAKLPDCLLSFLHIGCVRACLNFMKFHRDKVAREGASNHYLDAVNLIQRCVRTIEETSRLSDSLTARLRI